MKVQVRLFSNLARYLPPGSVGKRATVELDEKSTVADLESRLGLVDEPVTVLVNDERRHPQARLRDGDVVSLFPPIAGG